MEKTLGEKRVRTSFNVGNNDKVQNLKEKFAHLIDDVNELKGDPNVVLDGEKARLISLALTDLETSAMWAIKAATF